MLSKALLVILIFLNPLVSLVGLDKYTPDFLGFLKHSMPRQKSVSEEIVKTDNLRQVEQGILPINSTLLAGINSFSPNFLPIRDWNIKDPKIQAKAALVALVSCEKQNNLKKPLKPIQSKILFQKNSHQSLPIASLTKIMTAIVVLENTSIDKTTMVSQKAISTYGQAGNLSLNEKISIKKLLEAMLIESSNDAAVALAEYTEQQTGHNFKDMMNQKANELGLKNTHFADPSGLNSNSISSVRDFHLLMRYAFNYPLIWDILKTPLGLKYNHNGEIVHRWVNTNKLLSQIPKIMGGKTGYTKEAKECFAMSVKKEPQKYLIFIVLGSEDRFQETKKLMQWTQKAYQW